MRACRRAYGRVLGMCCTPMESSGRGGDLRDRHVYPRTIDMPRHVIIGIYLHRHRRRHVAWHGYSRACSEKKKTVQARPFQGCVAYAQHTSITHVRACRSALLDVGLDMAAGPLFWQCVFGFFGDLFFDLFGICFWIYFQFNFGYIFGSCGSHC